MRLTGEDPVQPVRIRDNARGYADMSDGFLRLIVIDREYEADFFRIADALLSFGGVYLDVGANYGLFTFGLAGKFGNSVDYHLFEPNAALHKSIEKSKQLYPALRIHLSPDAVSDHVGSVQIQIEEDQLGTTHVVESGGQPVTSTTIDSYLSAHRIDRVRLIKIDIEGHELAALKGARESLLAGRIDAIYFEYCEKWLERQHPPHDLIEYLETVGYAVCFCRREDLASRAGKTVLFGAGKGQTGVEITPISGRLPEMTDLLAVRRADLNALT
jgi:FkbM family methyltransferase